MSIIISQGSYVRTYFCDTTLNVPGKLHDTCLPVRVVPYHFVTPAFKKTYNNYNAICHPKSSRAIKYPCVGEAGVDYSKKVKGVHFLPSKAFNQVCRPYKPLTVKQKRIRIERQLLRDMRNRIRSPPRATEGDLKFKALEKRIYNDYLEELPIDKTTQVNYPPLEVEKDLSGQIGFDRSTQVTSADLGDWEEDITNFVNVITSKVTQQCLMEVFHEEELHQLRVRYRQLDELRRTRKEDEGEIEEAEEERQRNLAALLEDQRQRKQTQEDLLEKWVDATVTAEEFIRDLLPPVLEHLHSYGVHVDEVVEEINNAFKDALTEQVCRELSGPEQDILMLLIKEEIQNRYDIYTHPEKNERVFKPMERSAVEEHQDLEEGQVQVLAKRVQISSTVESMTILSD